MQLDVVITNGSEDSKGNVKFVYCFSFISYDRIHTVYTHTGEFSIQTLNFPPVWFILTLVAAPLINFITTATNSKEQ